LSFATDTHHALGSRRSHRLDIHPVTGLGSLSTCAIQTIRQNQRPELSYLSLKHKWRLATTKTSWIYCVVFVMMRTFRWRTSRHLSFLLTVHWGCAGGHCFVMDAFCVSYRASN